MTVTAGKVVNPASQAAEPKSPDKPELVVRVPAIRIVQDGIAMYLTRLCAETFKSPNFSTADAWSPKNRRGYQRPPSPKRFKAIAEYVRGMHGLKALLPQSIILNSRKPLIFEADPVSPDGDFGALTITSSMLPLYEVDGQNRLGGLRRAVDEDETSEIASYRVPVLIMDAAERITEALSFYVINTEQQCVPPDIAQPYIRPANGRQALHKVDR